MAQLQDSLPPGQVGPPGTTGATAPSSQSPIDAELAALKAQLDQARIDATGRDPDGSPSLAAIQARKSLPTLESEYRSLLIASTSAAKAASPRAPTQVGTNTSDKTITYVDANGQLVTVDNPNYVAPTVKPEDKPFSIPGPDGTPIKVNAADYNAYKAAQEHEASNALAVQGLQNTIANQSQIAQLKDYQNQLLLLKAQGQIDDQKAAEMFKEKYDQMVFDQTAQRDAEAARQNTLSNANTDLLTQNTLQNTGFNQQNALLQTGLSAGRDAVAAAQAGLQGAVGPGFGANFAAGLTAAAQGNPAGVKYGAGDFTTPMPNFQAIAAQRTAEAIAHLSPYAASMVGRPPPMAGYLPGGMPPTGPLLPQPTSQYLPPNNEAGAALAGAPVGGMPIPPYAPQVNRAVGANAQIQAGMR